MTADHFEKLLERQEKMIKATKATLREQKREHSNITKRYIIWMDGELKKRDKQTA